MSVHYPEHPGACNINASVLSSETKYKILIDGFDLNLLVRQFMWTTPLQYAD